MNLKNHLLPIQNFFTKIIFILILFTYFIFSLSSLASEPLKIKESLYPYVLSSFLAYPYKIYSNKSTKSSQEHNNAISERLNYAGYHLATVKDAPLSWIKSGLFKTKDLAFNIYDKRNNGLSARFFIHKYDKKIIFAFKGTDFQSFTSIIAAVKTTWAGLFTNLKLIASYCYIQNLHSLDNYSLMQAAIQYTEDLQQYYPSYVIELTGSSLGGAIAQHVALHTKRKAFVFNSIHLNPQVINSLIDTNHFESLELLTSFITHAYVEGDFLNDSFMPSLFIQNQSFIESIKISIPKDSNLYQENSWNRHNALILLKAYEADINLDSKFKNHL